MKKFFLVFILAATPSLLRLVPCVYFKRDATSRSPDFSFSNILEKLAACIFHDSEYPFFHYFIPLTFIIIFLVAYHKEISALSNKGSINKTLDNLTRELFLFLIFLMMWVFAAALLTYFYIAFVSFRPFLWYCLMMALTYPITIIFILIMYVAIKLISHFNKEEYSLYRIFLYNFFLVHLVNIILFSFFPITV